MDNWIKVEDRLPAIMEDVITWDRLAVCQGYYRQDGKWITVNSDGFGSTVKPCDVTHWMPLPEAPSGN